MNATKNIDLLVHLVDQAWALSDEQIAGMRPGIEGIPDALALLDVPPAADRPTLIKSRWAFENPDLHFLKLMRDPAFFPFTCRHLLSRPDGNGPLHLLPFQHLILRELWHRQFPMLVGSRGCGKSMILALYSLLRALFTPGSKVVITGATFRQSKQVFEYCERFWYNSPVLRTLVNSGARRQGRKSGPYRGPDRVEFVIGDSLITGLPVGNGESIRGLRANYVLVDEVASLQEEIYAVVIQGFASVTADPFGNVRDRAKISLLKRLGLWSKEMDADELRRVRGNQSVLSGTASYSFNHFCRYWQEYKQIVDSRGDPEVLQKMLGAAPSEGFKWNQYSVIRLPYSMVPKGYMDEATIARARRITNTTQFAQEYEAIFVLDSDGFFKRSLIERCVVGRADNPDPPSFPSCGEVRFQARLRGSKDRQYVYGIDPASEKDNFAVVVLECWPDHRRVVYAWTSSKRRHHKRVGQKGVSHDFFRYCVRHVRDLMKVFPAAALMVDHGGGGTTLREGFGDPDKLEPGELPIYECIDEDSPKPTDDKSGLHILHLVKFVDATWTEEANEGLKKDLEERVLLFPMLDSLAIGLALEEDLAAGRVVRDEEGNEIAANADGLEQCMHEIEALKDELTTIVVSRTSNGRRRWDVPAARQGGRKGYLRKDRYSALLMANAGARALMRAEEAANLSWFDNAMSRSSWEDDELYVQAPGWFKEQVAAHGADFGAIVRRLP